MLRNSKRGDPATHLGRYFIEIAYLGEPYKDVSKPETIRVLCEGQHQSVTVERDDCIESFALARIVNVWFQYQRAPVPRFGFGDGHPEHVRPEGQLASH